MFGVVLRGFLRKRSIVTGEELSVIRFVFSLTSFFMGNNSNVNRVNLSVSCLAETKRNEAFYFGFL